MNRSLGIFVSDNSHFHKLVKLCEAAAEKKIDVIIFLTHRGVLNTQDPEFVKVAANARVSICNRCFDGCGLKRPVPGLAEKDYGTQTRHGELIDECTRYVVL
ncbi:MAG: hypothetical protein ABSG91_14580 [Syntrophobacteraceae bacterium]